MFKRNLLSSAIILAGSAWGSPALADTHSGTQFGSPAEITKVSEWMGKDVQDNEGNEIGEISDFAINLNDGSVAYAVVGLSGMFNDQAIAVPLTALSASAESDAELTLQVSQSEWKSAETFTDSNWPLKASLAAGAGAAVVSTSMGTDASTNEATDTRQQSDDRYDQGSGSVSSLNPDAEFDTLDADGDGYLSTEEFQVTGGAPATDGTDQDQDGRISRSEFAAFESAEQESMMLKESSTDDRYEDTDDVDVDDRLETSE